MLNYFFKRGEGFMKKVFKKATAVLLTVVMMLTAAPLSGFVGLDFSWLTDMFTIEASAASYSGKCGANLTWTLDTDTGVLEITGTGDMTNWSSYLSVPWYSYQLSITTVNIGNSVTSIGDWAFYGCYSLTSVIIGNSVTSIGYSAFNRCDSLTSITIPDSVTSIEHGAFIFCDSLTSITIPDSVTSIGYDAFYGCYSLTSVTIGNSVTSIGSYAFEDCTSLTSITIPDSVTSIGNGVFSGCDGLTSITVDSDNQYYSSDSYGVLFNKDKTILIQYPIGNTRTSYTVPNSITSVGDSAFDGCLNLTTITIPDSVTSIGNSAFYCCYSLTNVTIGDSVTSIGRFVFFSCYNLASVKISDSVTSIGECAFKNCYSLTSITIPDSVTSIGDDAFYRCHSLTSVTIGNSVTSIGDYAFWECKSITNVTIGDSVTSIGAYAFDYCGSITSITVNADNQCYSSDSYGALFNKDKTKLIKYPAGNTRTEYIIPNSVTSIVYNAFKNCNKLTSIIIPDSVTSIGDDAFYYCSKLISVTIGDSVTSIGNSAFEFCSSLTSITIPDSVTSIGDHAFDGCSKLTSVTIGKSVTSIGDWVFDDCDSLTSIAVPNSVISIGGYAFYGCDSLADVYYGGSEEDWKKISIGSGNSYLTYATIHYNSPMPVSADLKYGADRFSFGKDITGYVGDKLDTLLLYKSSTENIGSLSITSSNPNVVQIDTIKIGVGEYITGENEHIATVTLKLKAQGSSTITITSPEGVSERLTVTVNKIIYDTDVYGDFKCPSGDSWSDGAIYKYKYSDLFFNYDSTKYHHDLALMSMALEASVCVPDGGWEKDESGNWVQSGDDYSGKYPANAEALFKNIGFENPEYFGYNTKPTFDSVACTIASKNIGDSTVVAVAVRGIGYEAEWGGNFNVGGSGANHNGFNIAKETVLGNIESYVTNHKNSFRGNVKFWIVGYSRAAATANLVAAEFDKGLSNTYANTKALNVSKGDLYCYCFETPLNTTDTNANSSTYNNIFSITNPIDPVTKVAPPSKGFNFKRYGQTYYLPTTETLSNYNQDIRPAMNKIHKEIYSEDYNEDFVFYEHNVGVKVISYVPLVVVPNITIKENKNIGQMTYMNNLIDILATEVFENRNNYEKNFQGAMEQIMAMLMGGYKVPDTDKLITDLSAAAVSFLATQSLINALDPVSNLKHHLSAVIEENTDITFAEAMDILSQVDNLLVTALAHPNYSVTTAKNAGMLFYPHYYHVLVGWMAYLDTLPTATREKLLSTSLKYRTVKVNCPVDVNVYDSEGNLVASIVNEEVVDIEDSLSTYIDENGQKCIVLPYDEDYRVEVIAREDCEVSYSIVETNGETLEEERVINYYDIEMKQNENIVCTAEAQNENAECEYTITDTDGATINQSESLTGEDVETYTVTVESEIDVTLFGGGEYTKGEYAQATAMNTDGNRFVGWYCGDEFISGEFQYRFRVTEDITLIAKYEYAGKVNKVTINDFTVMYKDPYKLAPKIEADEGVEYEVTYTSSNPDVVTVDKNGNVSTNYRGTATITVTVKDEFGNEVKDTCQVEVKLKWWQWIIWILLWGWAWY